MSITISTDVFCDGPSCGWAEGATVTGGKPKRNAARKLARQAGWRCEADGDFCPEHALREADDDSPSE